MIHRLLNYGWSQACQLAVTVFLVATTTAPSLGADVVRLQIYPPTVSIVGPDCEIRLIVTGIQLDGTEQDLTPAAELVSLNDAIVVPQFGRLVPVEDGRTEIVVRAAGLEARVPVEVAGALSERRVSFQNDVLAALSKQGCNAVHCHGSPSGKGGFRLSLRAFDPAIDEQTLLRESFNRRTNLLEPERSLLLLKPTMRVWHGGGQRLKKADFAYQVLRDWIEQGCQPDKPETKRVVKLELYPSSRTLHDPDLTQQLLALATYSDGSTRDVTRLTVFTNSDEAVASVDEAGYVRGRSRGETVVLARYLDQLATTSLTFLKEVPGFVWNSPPENNYIDTHVFGKLHKLQILPSDLCTDAEFVRRVHLDIVGVLPTPTETSAFIADAAPDRRARLIDRLLERPEHVKLWALKWADLLRVRNAKVTAGGVYKFHHWLVSAVGSNLPYDKFARELLTSSGSTFVHPPANYFRSAADMQDCTETTSQLFLGIRINCAKCHNHPFEKWTQDNYYGIAAFFNRVNRKPSATPDEQIIWLGRGGEVTQPRTGKQMQPWLPLSGSIELQGEVDRRERFVEWLTRPDNPFFAKVGVNRLWGQLMGRGIVDPIDDFRDTNPPASAELLAALADDFVQHGFDCKHMLRTMLNSRTYQLSSQVNSLNVGDVRYFSHAAARLMPAEQLLDAICDVTAVPEKFSGMPAGSRAAEVPSPDGSSDFMRVFGQPMRETVCACERSSDANLSQALQMINGGLVNTKVKAGDNRFRKLAQAGKSNPEIIGELYLAALCRPADAEELATAVAHVEKASDRFAGLEDVCWALLNSNEFLFQH